MLVSKSGSSRIKRQDLSPDPGVLEDLRAFEKMQPVVHESLFLAAEGPFDASLLVVHVPCLRFSQVGFKIVHGPQGIGEILLPQSSLQALREDRNNPVSNGLVAPSLP